MSAAGDRGTRGVLPEEWERLERAVEKTAVSLGRWSRRALENEEEVGRLRQSLEELAARNSSSDAAEEVRRLRAENAALKSRMLQARKRIAGLMQRLAALEVEE